VKKVPESKLREILLKYALINAIEHEGKADKKAVIKKLVVDEPAIREILKNREEREKLMQTAEEIINKVNEMPINEQEELLSKRFGITIEQILLERAKRTRTGLPPLPQAKKGKVITRFAPAPSGALHIGHILRAAFIPYVYAKKIYDGKFIVRLEDTDPRRIKPIYYEWILEDLKAVGIEWDELIYESDHFDKYYEVIEELFKRGKAYVCTCSREEFQKYKLQKKPCPHRDTQDDVRYWEKMLNGTYKEGEAVVRLKTKMADPNPALRDPPLARIIDSVPHPRTGYKYRVYPLYNFACAVEDHMSKVTHVIRAKEHEVNEHVQRRIYQALGWETPIFIQYGMLLIEGMELHKRHIREKLKKGDILGWDDITLPTVRALLRRGIHPKALRLMAFHVGLSLRDARVELKTLYYFNRQVINPIAKRIFFVEASGWKLTIKDAPEKLVARIPWNPESLEVGFREYRLFSTKKNGERVVELFISERDLDLLRDAVKMRHYLRLKGLATILIEDINEREKIVTAKFVTEKTLPGLKIIHWVPYADDLRLSAFLEKPNGEVIPGYVELLAANLRPGDYVQLERIGFGRIIRNEGEVVRIAFAHP